MSGAVLAIDGGKSGCRAAVYAGSSRAAQSTGPGLEHAAAPGGLDQIRAALESTCGALPPAGPYAAVCLGLTGVLQPDDHARRVAELLAATVPAGRVVVTSDVVTNFCGALGTRPGVVVAAGTGAIVLAIGRDGRALRVDGWGYLLDDAGSAFAIGRAGLRETLRVVDGRSDARALHDAALRRFGPVETLLDLVYASENPARTIAAFAEDVAAVAVAGDPAALAILGAAAGDLATGALAAARQVFAPDEEVALSWNGGVFRAGAPVLDPFLAAVRRGAPRLTPHPPLGDALDGAALLALDATRSGDRFAADLLTIHERTPA